VFGLELENRAHRQAGAHEVATAALANGVALEPRELVEKYLNY
jgi:hypothetical protein